MKNQSPPNPKTLIAIMSDKGGVGKSTMAELLWSRLLSSGRNVRAYDLDGTTGSFASRCGEYDEQGILVSPQSARGVSPIFLHGGADDRDRIAEMLETGADVVVADFPATSLTVLAQVESDWSFRDAIAEAGYSLTVVTMCTPYASSLANVSRSLDLFPHANHVVTLNEAFGDLADFFLWYGDTAEHIPAASSKARIEAMGARGGVIAFPQLNRRAAILTEKYMIRFAEAATDARMTMPMRARLRSWHAKVTEAMAPVDHLLGLATASGAKASAA